jgi:hypothetical protein
MDTNSTASFLVQTIFIIYGVRNNVGGFTPVDVQLVANIKGDLSYNLSLLPVRKSML